MTYDEAVDKLTVLRELGLSDVRVTHELWDAYISGVVVVHRVIDKKAAHNVESSAFFKDIIVRPPQYPS